MDATTFIKTIFFGQIIVACFSTYFAIKVLRRQSIPENIRFFALYPILSLIIGVPNIIHDYYLKSLKPFCNVLNNLTLIIHISLIGYFIYSVLKSKELKRIYIVLLSTFQLIIVWYLSSIDVFKTSYTAYGVTNFCIIIATLFYYFEVFVNPPVVKLTDEPSFWIISGVFFGMCLNMPFTATSNIILHENNDTIKMIMGAFLVLSFTLMHSFFVKGLKCTIRQHNI